MHIEYSGNEQQGQLGQDALNARQVGAIIVAGGQGTRLGYPGPKGCMPLTEDGKTLFELQLSTLEPGVPVAIMTSPENDAATRAFLAEHDNFGVPATEVSIFVQPSLPLLDEKGEAVEVDGVPLMGSTGNGAVYRAFITAGLGSRWRQRGIRYVTFSQIDNALANLCDPELVGCHRASGAEVTIKATRRRDPEERVGVLIDDGNRVKVVEYTELPDGDRYAITEEGQLRYAWANLSMFCFDLAFIDRVAAVELPWHTATKQLPGRDTAVQKRELFVFDALSYSKSTAVFVVERERCFAPVKNRIGDDSPQSARRLLAAARVRLRAGRE